MSTMSQLIKEISVRPLAEVIGTYRKFSGDTTTAVTKAEAVEWVANAIARGMFTAPEIRPYNVQTPMQATQPAAPAALLAEVENVSARLQQLETSVSGSVHRQEVARLKMETDLQKAIAESIKTSGEMVSGLRQDVLKVAATRASVDPAAIKADIAKAIADAFVPFQQAVIDAKAEAVVGELAAVACVDRKPAADIFGFAIEDHHGNELMVDLYNDPTAPAIDAGFVWQDWMVRAMVMAQETGSNIWLGGEKGTGKSTLAAQWAARCGRSFTRLNFQKYTTADDHVGSVGLEAGNTAFKEGDFLKAFSRVGAVILMDEVTNADPASLAIYNALLEPNCAVSIGGKVRRRASGCLILAADNTLTNGDESGRYAGTKPMNSAFGERFDLIVHCKHLPIKEEIKAVVNRTGCNPQLAAAVLRVIHTARAKVQTGDIVDAPSIRQAIAFIRAVKFMSVDQAWESVVGNRQPSESAAAIAALKAAELNAAEIIKLI